MTSHTISDVCCVGGDTLFPIHANQLPKTVKQDRKLCHTKISHKSQTYIKMVTAYVMHHTHGKKQCNDLQTYILYGQDMVLNQTNTKQRGKA